MEIGTPVEQLPPKLNPKYEELKAAVTAAAPRWVPVTCEDKQEIERIYQHLAIGTRHKFEVRRKTPIIYIRVNPNGATPPSV